MKPNWYFEIDMPEGGRDEFSPAPAMRNRLLGILHAFFSQNPHNYAVALPKERNRLRVFASSRDDLDKLVAYLTPNRWIRDYVRLSYPVSVETLSVKKWQSYCRYRIPTDKSDRKTGEEKGLLRQRRMKQARDKGMEFFIVHSKSTGQSYSFFINRIDGQPSGEECLPNSYGFSTTDKPFYLPEPS